MDIIITAGGRITGEFIVKTGVTIKALIEMRGKPIISTVVDALSGLTNVGKIYVRAVPGSVSGQFG